MTTITGIDVFMALLLICGLFVGVLYLLSIKNEQEKKINNIQDENDVQKIHEAVANETVDMLNADIASRDPTAKPKA